MNISPDQTLFWQKGFFHLNLTILMTWILMLVLVVGARLITRRLQTGPTISRWQAVLEMIVIAMTGQLREVGLTHPEKYIGFVGTLFVFIASSTMASVIPGFEAPTGSLSTTAGLALCVFVSVPLFGIEKKGIKNYLRSYFEPNFLLFPFHVVSEISRTIALSVRLFGNIMSEGLIISILLGIAPFFFPVLLKVLGLLTGMVQAYIFAILAAVYIAAGMEENIISKKIKIKRHG